MALPTTADLKAYLRIEGTAEDALLAQLLARALGLVQAYLGRPITAAAQTFPELVAYLVDLRWVLFLPVRPAAAEPLEVKDADGAVVDPATYRLDRDRGMVIAKAGQCFSNGPYDVTATVGCSAGTDYATALEPVLAAAIIDAAADLYQRRNPAASSESEAGGGGTGFVGTPGLPPRVTGALEPYVMRRV